jgi:ribosomal subunit interface protein
MELTDDLKAYVKTKIDALERHIPNSDAPDKQIEARITLEETAELKRDGNKPGGMNYLVEANIHVSGNVFRAESRREDIHIAITEAKDELKRELRKYTESNRTEHRSKQREFKQEKKISSLALGKRAPSYEEFGEEEA